VFALQDTGPSTLSPTTLQRVYERSHAKIFLVILYDVETIERGRTPATSRCHTPIFNSESQSRLVHTNIGTGLIINVARGKRFGLFGIGQRWLEGKAAVGRNIRFAGVLP
jgi:hypothetical protein